MDLTRYVEELLEALRGAAEGGGDDACRLAEHLAAPLQSTARLVLLDALAVAAGEITSELAPGSVEVRLRGRDPEFVVTSPPDDHDDAPPTHRDPSPDEPAERGTDADDGATARLTLRLPEALKSRIEDAAGREGLSVNAWLVRTLDGVLDPATGQARATRPPIARGQRFTGWTRT